jgi:hypothetical protein
MMTKVAGEVVLSSYCRYSWYSVVTYAFIACYLLSTFLFPVPTSALPVTDDEKWLVDFETAPRQWEDDNKDDNMQADSPVIVGRATSRRRPPSAAAPDDDTPTCPPLLDLRQSDVQQQQQLCVAMMTSSVGGDCKSDVDCVPTGRKCCPTLTGCRRRTCVVPIKPAPYIDWKYEPQSRLASGRSWLIQGSDEDDSEVEWCSTSYSYDDPAEDAEPLLCPQGYICHIDFPGDIDSDIPNRGRCLPESTSGDSVQIAQDTKNVFRMTSVSTGHNGQCVVSDKLVYNNGEMFPYGNHNCKCEDGSVLCHVGQKLHLRPPSSSLVSAAAAAAVESTADSQ